MITIFCDFCQFSAKNLALFLKESILWWFLSAGTAVIWIKNAIFYEIFSAIKKIITSAPVRRICSTIFEASVSQSHKFLMPFFLSDRQKEKFFFRTNQKHFCYFCTLQEMKKVGSRIDCLTVCFMQIFGKTQEPYPMHTIEILNLVCRLKVKHLG
jgi:ribosomal protein L37AE/L43A